MTDSDNESDEDGDFGVVYGGIASPVREDQCEIITGASGVISHGWLYDLDLICTNGKDQ